MAPKKGKIDLRPNQNMGRLQKAEPHWRDGGSSSERENNYYRGPEWSDRQEREAYGKPLVAAYRHLLGPTPTLRPGDTTGALYYLSRIEVAIEQGGWTRSEWRRLRILQSRWKARATGADPRFKEVGNISGGLTKFQTANIGQQKIVAAMLSVINKSRSRGD